MGACLSCLGGGNEDDDINERTSLLGGNTLPSDEDLQEELLKQQQRQNELSNIVSDLNDHLIDVSTFLSNNTSVNGGLNSRSYPASLNLLSSPKVHDADDTDMAGTSSVGPAGLEAADRQYPHLAGVDEKVAILKAVESLSKEEQQCEIPEASGPLYVVF